MRRSASRRRKRHCVPPRARPPTRARAKADAKSGYLQAARRAAQYAAQNAQRGDAAAPGDPDKAGGKLGQRLKAIFVGISVAVIIVVALRFAASYLQSADLGPTSGAPAVAQRPAAAPLIVASARSAAGRRLPTRRRW